MALGNGATSSTVKKIETDAEMALRQEKYLTERAARESRCLNPRITDEMKEEMREQQRYLSKSSVVQRAFNRTEPGGLWAISQEMTKLHLAMDSHSRPLNGTGVMKAVIAMHEKYEQEIAQLRMKLDGLEIGVAVATAEPSPSLQKAQDLLTMRSA
jgi:hypothetical protein